MNALVAMDELMGSNEMNMKLAAMTPAFLIVYGIRYTFRIVFYALLKIGKSKEEIFASFRLIILDIERLLVMRNDPPLAPAPLTWGVATNDGGAESALTERRYGHNVLSAEDLGMLMLLVHECRKILWEG